MTFDSSAYGRRLRLSAASIAASPSFWLIATGLLTLILYAPTLGYWFFSDDFLVLRAAHFVGPLGYIREAFDFSYYDDHARVIDFLRDFDIPLPFVFASYRPLTWISLEGMHLVFGDKPAGYHAVSLAVHLANTLLVWLIASRLMRSRLGPFLAATVFALHPAYVIAVAWITDIGTPLATGAALLSLLSFMKSTETDPPHRTWYLVSIASFGASTFFHQETIPWFVVLAAFLFLVDPAHRNRMFDLASWAILSPYIWIAVSSFALQLWIGEHTPIYIAPQLGSHMLTHFKNFASNSLLPAIPGQAAAHFVAFVSFLVMLVALPAMAYLPRRKRALPRGELFVILWFFASLAPLLTIDFWFDVDLNRKLYAAGPALAIFLAMFGTSLVDLVPRRLQVPSRAFASLLLLLALAGAMVGARNSLRDLETRALEAKQFVSALRETYPSLPQGSTLYVVDAPDSLRYLGDVHLVGAVQAFYGRVDVYGLSEEEATSLETLGVAASSECGILACQERLLTLDANDQIFRYKPGSR
jgi:hypothetical protein